MVPANILEQVVTWNMADLDIFQNMNAFVATSNTLFKDPEEFQGNLGSTVSYETPPRLVSEASLNVNFQPIQQNARTLTVSQSANVSYAGTAEQIVFNNLAEYSKRLGDSAMAELSSKVESDVATLCETIPYRFYGNGNTAINSAQQLAQMLNNFRSYSSAPGTIKVYLDLRAVPAIVNTMQNQFTLERNNENAESWVVGNWAGVEYYQSNMLPMHTSGTVGQNGTTLTVTSTNDPMGNNITQITCSGATADDVNAIKKFDLAQFTSGGSYPLPMWLTFVGHTQTTLSVQFQITADAAANGSGDVVLNIYPPLCATVGSQNQNIPGNIYAGMELQVTNTAVRGMALSDDALYVAMPMLPSTAPFPSSSAMDPDSGVSVRLYYGVIPFQNVYGWTRDVIWGKDAVPQNTMALLFPVMTGVGIGM
jgi:hypothetical protein